MMRHCTFFALNISGLADSRSKLCEGRDNNCFGGAFRGLAELWQTHVQSREPFLWHHGDPAAVVLCAKVRGGIPSPSAASGAQVFEERFDETRGYKSNPPPPLLLLGV